MKYPGYFTEFYPWVPEDDAVTSLERLSYFGPETFQALLVITQVAQTIWFVNDFIA
jgi:hypothetical protein